MSKTWLQTQMTKHMQCTGWTNLPMHLCWNASHWRYPGCMWRTMWRILLSMQSLRSCLTKILFPIHSFVHKYAWTLTQNHQLYFPVPSDIWTSSGPLGDGLPYLEHHSNNLQMPCKPITNLIYAPASFCLGHVVYYLAVSPFSPLSPFLPFLCHVTRQPSVQKPRPLLELWPCYISWPFLLMHTSVSIDIGLDADRGGLSL
jgi:hypothetical protein